MPIGFAIITFSSINPAELYGGSWEQVSSGYALWTATSGVGETIGAGLPNITGSWSGNRVGTSLDVSGFDGALYNIGTAGSDRLGAAMKSGTQGIHFGFDASRSNSIYGNSSTVQPPAIKIYLWKRTA